MLHSREAMVGTRTKLVNHVRATVKSLGHRLPACSAQGFPRKVAEHLPEPLRPAFGTVEAEMLSSPDDPAALTDEGARAAAERIFRLAVELWGS